MSELEPDAEAGLERTRRMVLNVLTGVGGGIAVSGAVLSQRAKAPAGWVSPGLERSLTAFLLIVVVTSYAVRRVGASRNALRAPGRRLQRFYRAHVAAALIGALAIPAGLLHGWFIQPSLAAVAPYWAAAITLGILSFPRASALLGLDEPLTPGSESHE